MKIEVLYIADCPHYPSAVDRVRHVLRSVSLSEIVEEIEVCTSGEAEALRFIGSPTVRVNGLDVEPEARSVNHFGMGCRSYLENGRRSGLPSTDLLLHSLSGAPGVPPEQSAGLLCGNQAAVAPKRAESGVLVAGGIAAVLASTCCLGPLLLVTLGLSGAWIGDLALLEPYRPWFIAAALVALFFAGPRIFRHPASCASGEICGLPPVRRANKAFFGVVAALVVVAFLYPYVARLFY